MITDINEGTLDQVRNPALRAYAARYLRIYQDFMEQVAQTGVGIEPQGESKPIAPVVDQLQKKGVRVRNDGKSLYINRISPSCQACQTAEGSATFFISLRCHRSCFFCFNPNQENYEHFQHASRDLKAELDEMHAQGQRLRHIGLTGGEPLLHKPEAVEFFRYAKEVFPGAYTRLYTSGDHIDVDILQSLKDAHLDEIRFSIRLYDLPKGRSYTLDRIRLAAAYIPHVLVEMPVLPNSFEEMKEILVSLDQAGIFGINLLEFCFPFHNADIYRMKNYPVKAHPFRVLYDYWYAGGLPVAGSEAVCLSLLEFALESKLKMGVHYCSLENKHTGQLHQQNSKVHLPGLYRFSQKDYFIKSAKVFGDDIPAVLACFKKEHFEQYQLDHEQNCLEFPVEKVSLLHKMDVEVGLAYYVVENRDGENILRELKVDLITPANFQISDI